MGSFALIDMQLSYRARLSPRWPVSGTFQESCEQHDKSGVNVCAPFLRSLSTKRHLASCPLN